MTGARVGGRCPRRMRGTQHLIRQLLEVWGMRGIPVRAGDAAAVRDAIAGAQDPRLALVETPAHPPW